MNEEPNIEKDKRMDEIREQLSELMQEWIHLTDDSEGTTGIMTACVISFESTRFNDDGNQGYRTDYIALGPTSYSSTIGILNETLWEIHHRGFGHCHGGE